MRTLAFPGAVLALIALLVSAGPAPARPSIDSDVLFGPQPSIAALLDLDLFVASLRSDAGPGASTELVVEPMSCPGGSFSACMSYCQDQLAYCDNSCTATGGGQPCYDECSQDFRNCRMTCFSNCF